MSTPDGEKLAMWFEEPKDFTEALKTISQLHDLLTCNKCGKLMQDPINLWGCDHAFCWLCAKRFEICPVCSLPAWNEDQHENKAVTVILEKSKALKKLLEDYMDFSKKSRTSESDSAIMFPGGSQDKNIPAPNVRVTLEQTYNQGKPLETKKELKTPKQNAKFKITPVKPFPEIFDDSEETQLPVANLNNPVEPSSVMFYQPTKLNPKPEPKKSSSVFATPTPPKKKRPSSCTPFMPKTSAKKFSPVIKKRAILKTPKTPTNPKNLAGTLKNMGMSKTLITPMKSPGMSKTPKTPKSAKKNKKGETLLHLAAIKGNIEEVKDLLHGGVDINAKDNAGWAPLHEACNHGHVDVVGQLLDAGALINIPGYDDETPLMDATRQGHADVIKYLLDRGADAFLRTANGLTAADLTTRDDIVKIFEDHILASQAMVPSNTEGSMDVPPERIILTYHFNLNVAKINQVAEVLDATLSPKDALTATHYIAPSYDDGRSPRHVKYLQSVARGIWVLKTDWLEACKAARSWVGEQNFELVGSKKDIFEGGPKRSRMNRAAKCPPIFHGCHFFLYGLFKTMAKPIVTELIQMAGGSILTREPKSDSDSVQSCTKVPYHAHKDTAQYFYTYYIVYDSENDRKPSRFVRRGKVCTVPLKWIFDSISQFYLCEIPEGLEEARKE